MDTAAIDRQVLNYAVLGGALNLLPGPVAALAVVSAQMTMVYRIGRNYGYTLDRGHLREFLAIGGVGLVVQGVDQVARRLIGGIAGGWFGAAGGVAAGAGTGAIISFASTYALGQLADRYYAGGRRMSLAVLRETYRRLQDDGRRLFRLHAADVRNRADTLRSANVIDLVCRTP